MEYYNLKLENRNNYTSSFCTDSLAIMICDYYELDKENSTKIIKDSMSVTKTPIELLNMIKNRIQ
ncbi:MAG: hypothetical protein PHE16_11015 [Aliarcobacter sp.]|nr:hypothetical protein [Aliarcobacter sp.]